ncbi:MAG: hypothetical protein K9J81_10245, partial [Desulfohalobiaceae bacterium]|nr:hypothetical protein [Desulfohalobiaceae bacterium]
RGERSDVGKGRGEERCRMKDAQIYTDPILVFETKTKNFETAVYSKYKRISKCCSDEGNG